MLARTLPFGPTVKRLCDSRTPSTSPSTKSSSRVRISPLMFMDAPIAAACAAGAGARGGAATGWGCICGEAVRGGSACGRGAVAGSSGRLFHTDGSPYDLGMKSPLQLHLKGHPVRCCARIRWVHSLAVAALQRWLQSPRPRGSGPASDHYWQKMFRVWEPAGNFYGVIFPYGPTAILSAPRLKDQLQA